MEIEELFETLKENYTILANENSPIKYRLIASRVIIQNIVEFYIAIPEINEIFYTLVRENKKKNQKIRREKTGEDLLFEYKNTHSGKLFYLIHIKEIPKNLENAFHFIWREASGFAAHQLNGKVNEQMIGPSQIFGTEIIKWFYKKHNKDASFILNSNVEESSVNLNPELKTPTQKRKVPLLKIILSILIIGFSYFIFQKTQSYFSKQQKIEEERNIIENAKEKSSTRTVLLSNIYSAINQELKEDYNNDGIRNLSKELIGRVISLSGTLNPYKYKRDSTIVKYSPERASLFNSLIRYKLSIKTYQSIFNEANFSFSDFSGFDLSKLDLIKLINGIKGSMFNDAQLLVTIAKRPNLKNSNFEKANLNESKLYGDFSGSTFKNAQLKKVLFNWTKATDVIFGNNDLVIQISNSDFSNSDFNSSTLYCAIKNSDLRGVNFDGCKFYNYRKYFNKNSTFDDSYFVPYDETFSNVFLSSNALFSEFKFNMHETSYRSDNYVIKSTKTSTKSNKKVNKPNLKYRNQVNYKARSFLSSYHYTNNGSTYLMKVPIDLVKPPEGEEKIMLSSTFDLIGNDFNNQDFIRYWKQGTDNFFSYIIRSNDMYFDTRYIIDERKILTKEGNIIFKNDTIYQNSGKSFHSLIYSKSDGKSIGYCNPKLLESKKKIASFKNCAFYNISFKTKISNISFEGSLFENTFFHKSELYNINFKNVKGFLFFKSKCKFDSLIVDKNFSWFRIAKMKDSILNIKHNFPKKDYTLKDHLLALKKVPKQSSSIHYPLGYSSMDLNILKERFEIFQDLGERIVYDKLNSFKELIIRDKNYLKLLKKYDK
jgi:uncharacterized protein YjbI with pentapeptide repeats